MEKEIKILHLSLIKEPFDLMVKGLKLEEYRKPTKWIKSRLYEKNGKAKKYDVIKFTNGYGKDKPYFICKYLYFDVAIFDYTRQYKGFKVFVSRFDYIINCGEIIEKGNLKK